MPGPGFPNQSLKQRAGLAVIEAALVVGVLYFLGHRDWLFIGPIAAALAISALAPPRLSYLVAGVCMLALAVFFYQHFGMRRIPTVLGVIGAVALVFGIASLARSGRQS